MSARLKYTFIFDYHKWGHNSEGAKISGSGPFGKRVVYGGDCWELVRVSKKDAPYRIKFYNEWQDDCDRTGTLRVDSNHAGKYSNAPFYIILEDRAVVTHGHVTWSQRMQDKWKKKSAGTGKMMMLFSRIFSKARHIIKKTSISKKQLKRLDKFMSEINVVRLSEGKPIVTECHMGHMHPSENIVQEYNGITYFVYTKGIHDVLI